mgnify:CR=1 FL=1
MRYLRLITCVFFVLALSACQKTEKAPLAEAEKDPNVVELNAALKERVRLVKVGESEISFIIGESQIISQLTEGKYPDYQKIIPANSSTTIVCDKDKLVEAVKVSSVFAREIEISI